MKKLLAITALSAALFFGQTAAAEEKAAEEVKPSHVEMVLVLDESGSMSNLTNDTIGGFNSMIEKEKKLDVDAHVTTVLFNDQYKMLYNRRELKDVRKMTDKDYTPGGMTALLDAVGRTIHKMDMVSGIHRKDKGNKVLFVIITDGEENDSREYTYADVKKLIKDRQENAGWEFIFLGANIDAAAAAENLGIDRDRAVKYKNTGSGVRANFKAVAELSDSLAKSGRVSDEWKSQVEEDTDENIMAAPADTKEHTAPSAKPVKKHLVSKVRKALPRQKESLFHFCCHLDRNGNSLRRGVLTQWSFLSMQTKKEPLQALNPFQLPKGSFPSPHSSGVLQYLICRQMHLSFSLYSSGMKSMILLNVSSLMEYFVQSPSLLASTTPASMRIFMW